MIQTFRPFFGLEKVKLIPKFSGEVCGFWAEISGTEGCALGPLWWDAPWLKQHSKSAVLVHEPCISNLFGVHVFVGFSVCVCEALCKVNLMRENWVIHSGTGPPPKRNCSKRWPNANLTSYMCNSTQVGKCAQAFLADSAASEKGFILFSPSSQLLQSIHQLPIHVPLKLCSQPAFFQRVAAGLSG